VWLCWRANILGLVAVSLLHSKVRCEDCSCVVGLVYTACSVKGEEGLGMGAGLCGIIGGIGGWKIYIHVRHVEMLSQRMVT